MSTSATRWVTYKGYRVNGLNLSKAKVYRNIRVTQVICEVNLLGPGRKRLCNAANISIGSLRTDTAGMAVAYRIPGNSAGARLAAGGIGASPSRTSDRSLVERRMLPERTSAPGLSHRKPHDPGAERAPGNLNAQYIGNLDKGGILVMRGRKVDLAAGTTCPSHAAGVAPRAIGQRMRKLRRPASTTSSAATTPRTSDIRGPRHSAPSSAESCSELPMA